MIIEKIKKFLSSLNDNDSSQNNFDVNEFLKKAEQGDNMSMAALANYYGSISDFANMLKWAQLGHEKGNAECTYILGSALLNGEGVAKDETKAYKYFETAAKNGSCCANMFYGRLFLGLGNPNIKEDAQKAFPYLMQAVNNLKPEIEDDFHMVYGNCAYCCVMKKDFKTAITLANRGAELNDCASFIVLGIIYRQGFEVPKNNDMAKMYMHKAEKSNEPKDWIVLAYSILSDIYAESRDFNNALKYAQKAADLGFGPCMLAVSVAYEKGIGGYSKNLEKAAMWKNRAIAAGAKC